VAESNVPKPTRPLTAAHRELIKLLASIAVEDFLHKTESSDEGLPKPLEDWL